MTVMFTDRQFDRIQTTARELRKITKKIHGTQKITAVQRDELVKVSRCFTDLLAEHQR